MGTDVEADTEVIDADGHVNEDVVGIARRLSSPFRELRQRQIEGGYGETTGRGSGLFPPVTWLANTPMEVLPNLRRGPKEMGENIESWEYFLEAVGIARTVLYPTAGLQLGRVRDLDYAVDLCRAYNDWIAETYMAHPSGRFRAAALLPLQVPEAAVAELARVKSLGFDAATLPSHGLPNHLGSLQFFPLFEAAEELDIPLSCHGGLHDGLGFDDFNVFAPAHALGHPFSLLISLGGMVFNGVFDRFPGLRVAFLEGGSAWTLVAVERFSESFRAFQPVSHSSLKLKEGYSVGNYLQQLAQEGRIAFGCEGGETHLSTAIEYFGCTPFMYSSDFPHEVDVQSCKHELGELAELTISDEQKAEVRAGTARRFYRLA